MYPGPIVHKFILPFVLGHKVDVPGMGVDDKNFVENLLVVCGQTGVHNFTTEEKRATRIKCLIQFRLFYIIKRYGIYFAKLTIVNVVN